MSQDSIRDGDSQSRTVPLVPIPPHPPLRRYYREVDARQDFLNELFNRTAYQYRNIEKATGFGSGIWYRRKALLEAGLLPGMHVLDVACGPALVAQCARDIVGPAGSVIGLDPSIGMLREARKSSCDKLVRGVGEHLPFPDATFDVVWAIESVCYAWDKADFTKEAFRVLKPGGKLVVADFFSTPVQPGSPEDMLMKKWTDSWAIKSYATVNEFQNALSVVGFQNIRDQDITQHVTPSIRRLYLSFFPGLITTTVAEWIGARNSIQTKNTWSTYYQYQAFKKHLWQYHIFSAQKD